MPEPVTRFADAVIVAAGSSRRMHGLDKLQADLGGRPVLRWTVENTQAAHTVRRVIVVAAPERMPELSEADWIDGRDVTLVEGGARRQDSVANGVRESDGDVVLVHDGARPLATSALIDRVAVASAEHGAAIPVLPVVDSLKRVADGRVTDTAERARVFRAQTPQGARRQYLAAALDAWAAGPEEFGDEHELLARLGIPVATVAGESSALKITGPDDLEVCRSLVEHGARAAVQVRYGWGQDSHPFGAADGLHLGGLEIPEAPRLHGHSDGDAALHAICDGALAATRLGDLGRLFPAGDRQTRGVDSRQLLRSVTARLADEGWSPASVDLTIVGARPRLGAARLDRIREVVAGLVGLPLEQVSVKASTGNLSGDDGAGRTISATALVGVVAR